VAACIKAWRAAHNQPSSWQQNGGASSGGGGYSNGYALGAGGASNGLLAANGEYGSESRVVYPGLSVQTIRLALQRFRCAPALKKQAGKLKLVTTESAQEEEESNCSTGGCAKDEEEQHKKEDEEEDEVEKAVSAAEEECPICLEELSSDPPPNLGGAGSHNQSCSCSSSNGYGGTNGTCITLGDLLVGKSHGSSSSENRGGGGGGGRDGRGILRGLILATPCGGLGANDDSDCIAGRDASGSCSGPGGRRSGSNMTYSGSAGGPMGRRHAFHALCLCDWLRRSCRCPLCKTDLRPFLREE